MLQAVSLQPVRGDGRRGRRWGRAPARRCTRRRGLRSPSLLGVPGLPLALGLAAALPGVLEVRVLQDGRVRLRLGSAVSLILLT